MSTHAKFSPSGAHRWMTCPGSIKAEEGLPDNGNKYAERGTRAHSLAHYLLDPVNAPFAESDDRDMSTTCEAYVNYVQSLMAGDA